MDGRGDAEACNGWNDGGYKTGSDGNAPGQPNCFVVTIHLRVVDLRYLGDLKGASSPGIG